MSRLKPVASSLRQGQTIYIINQHLGTWTRAGCKRPTVDSYRIMSKNYVRRPLGEVDMNIDHAKWVCRNRGFFYSKRKAKSHMKSLTPLFELPVYWPEEVTSC